MDETKLLQDSIVDKLGLQPVDKEVVVLYDGERDKVFIRQFYLFFFSPKFGQKINSDSMWNILFTISAV